MICRICGHSNKNRDTGPCENCGFSLDDMNKPLKEMRASLAGRIEKPVSFQERVPLRTHTRSTAGMLGFLVFFVGLLGTLLLVNTHDRATRTLGGNGQGLAGMEDQQEEEVDSLPIRMGVDLVYVLNEEGTAAIPHTNLNLNMMPQGATICIAGPPQISIRPVVNYIATKKTEVRGTLTLEKLACWEDTTMTDFRDVPLWVQPEMGEDSVGPVVLKLLFLEEWLVGRCEELEIDVPAPLPDGFTEAKLDSVLNQVGGRIDRNREEIGDREVQVAALFPDTTTLGTAMDRLQVVYPKVDTLGYRAFDIKWFRLEE
jgi:hypothetical protein